MKKIFTLIFSCFMFCAIAQTTVYTTGQSYTDAWTGWSTPVVTNISSNSVNGAYIYNFNGTTGQAYTIEIYRQFTIYTDDMDIWLTATTENCLVSVEYSSDNVSYTQIGSQSWGAGFAVSTLIIPTYNPVANTFYLKLKMAGTFGSPSQANFNSLKIDAVVLGTASTPEFAMGSNVFFKNGILEITPLSSDYSVAVFDITGKYIAGGVNLKQCDISSQQPGIYFASFDYDGQRKTFKLVHTR